MEWKSKVFMTIKKETYRYIAAGILLVMIDFSVFFLTSKLGAHYLISQSIAVAICSIIGAKIFREFVFSKSDRRKCIKSNVLLLNISNAISLFVSYLMLYALIDILSFATVIAKIIVTGVLTVANYMVRKYIIFI